MNTGIVKKLISVAAVMAAMVLTPNVKADDNTEDNSYVVSADWLFVPKGFDDNDNIMAVLDGWVNSSCDRVLPPKVLVHPEQGVVEIEVRATRPENVLCMPVLTRYTVTADMGILPQGKYEVITNNGWLVEELNVEEATSSGPDDYLYAQVDEVLVDYAPDYFERDSHWSVLLMGRYLNSCQTMEDVVITDSGRTIEVQPILKEEGEICIPVETPFQVRKYLPEIMEEGRYLLHVRTMHGNALNHVFSAFE